MSTELQERIARLDAPHRLALVKELEKEAHALLTTAREVRASISAPTEAEQRYCEAEGIPPTIEFHPFRRN